MSGKMPLEALKTTFIKLVGYLITPIMARFTICMKHWYSYAVAGGLHLVVSVGTSVARTGTSLDSSST